MKQCPVCKSAYTDDSLSFCLSDGATLFVVADEVETRVISPGDNPVRINIPPETALVFTPPTVSNQTTQPNSSSKIVGLLIGLLALVILLFIGVVAFVLLKPDNDKKPENSTSPTPSVSKTPDEKITNLKNQKKSTPVPTQKPKENTARVNSPGDGFLALRSEPDAETGYRLAKIPHGASVDVLGCQSSPVKIGSRTGRWCQVNYEGQSGWAFDAWLDY